MKIKKIITVLLILLLLTNCEKDKDIIDNSNLLINTTWIGVETFNCTKPEGCTEQQILKFNTGNVFTYQYIDGHHGTYDTIIDGTYTYSHPELILKTQEGTLDAMVNENNICLDSGINCQETSSEFLVKQ
tara:strand:+ start:29194 stop:29583 length:390 start_codon:yes stop_codon:yes gene_type:complete